MSTFTTTDGREMVAQFYGFAAEMAEIDYESEAEEISAIARREIEAASDEGIWKLIDTDGHGKLVTDSEYHALRP